MVLMTLHQSLGIKAVKQVRHGADLSLSHNNLCACDKRKLPLNSAPNQSILQQPVFARKGASGQVYQVQKKKG